MTLKRLIVSCWLIMMIAIGYNTYQGFTNANSLAAQQQKTCLVQKRGLSATPHLVDVMRDFAKLLTPQKGQKKVPQPYRGVIADLRVQLGDYVDIESRQPKHRTCNQEA